MPARIEMVTFTGADDVTSPGSVSALADNAYYAGIPVEIAVLCSFARAGRPRYPTPEHAIKLLEQAISSRATIALHICGTVARRLLTGSISPMTWCDAGWLGPLTYAATHGRIQVNADAELTSPATMEVARNLIAVASGVPRETVCVIGQHRDPDHWPSPTEPPVSYVADTRPQVSYLFDRSGGTGVPATRLPALPAGTLVGLAGGFGVDADGNPLPALNAALEHAYAASDGAQVWLDMETNIRDRRPEIVSTYPLYPGGTDAGGDGYFSERMCCAVLGHPLLRKLAARYE